MPFAALGAWTPCGHGRRPPSNRTGPERRERGREAGEVFPCDVSRVSVKVSLRPASHPKHPLLPPDGGRNERWQAKKSGKSGRPQSRPKAERPPNPGGAAAEVGAEGLEPRYRDRPAAVPPIKERAPGPAPRPQRRRLNRRPDPSNSNSSRRTRRNPRARTAARRAGAGASPQPRRHRRPRRPPPSPRLRLATRRRPHPPDAGDAVGDAAGPRPPRPGPRRPSPRTRRAKPRRRPRPPGLVDGAGHERRAAVAGSRSFVRSVSPTRACSSPSSATATRSP